MSVTLVEVLVACLIGGFGATMGAYIGIRFSFWAFGDITTYTTTVTKTYRVNDGGKEK